MIFRYVTYYQGELDLQIFLHPFDLLLGSTSDLLCLFLSDVQRHNIKRKVPCLFSRSQPLRLVPYLSPASTSPPPSPRPPKNPHAPHPIRQLLITLLLLLELLLKIVPLMFQLKRLLCRPVNASFSVSIFT